MLYNSSKSDFRLASIHNEKTADEQDLRLEFKEIQQANKNTQANFLIVSLLIFFYFVVSALL